MMDSTSSRQTLTNNGSTADAPQSHDINRDYPWSSPWKSAPWSVGHTSAKKIIL